MAPSAVDSQSGSAGEARSVAAKPPLTSDLVRVFVTEVKRRLELQAFEAWLTGNGDIELGLLVVPKGQARNQGSGTAAMHMLAAFADAYGCRIILSPALPDDRHGTTSRARLVRFYRRFGFYENKGRRKDYAVSAGMIREPRPVPQATPEEPSEAREQLAPEPGHTPKMR